MIIQIARYTATTLTIDRGIESCVVSWDTHGEATARVVLRGDSGIDDLYAARITIYDRSAPVWTGRIENVESDGETTTITAYGPWRVMGDARYTAVWSVTSTARWREATQEEAASTANGRYQIDFNNRVYISPRKGEVHGNAGRHMAIVVWRAPQRSRTDIRHVSLNWNVDLPGGMTWNYFITTRSWHQPGDTSANILVDTIFSGSGVASGTYVAAPPATSGILYIALRVSNIIPPPLAADTDVHFARATNVRIAAKTPPVRASDIARDVIAAAREGNEDWIVGGAVSDTNDDVTDALYEDADPRAILDDLARRNNYIVYAERGVVTFRPLPAYPTVWTVEPRSVTLARGIEASATRAYATYQARDGETLRTAHAESALAGVGFRRTHVIDARTTSLTTAEALRNAYLLTQHDLSTRILVRARHGDITDGYAPVTGVEIRPYDVLRFAAAPLPTPARVGKVTVELTTMETTIELLSPADTLENALQ